MRLRHSDPATPENLVAVQAIWVSNHLYGNDVTSAYEMEKGIF